MKKILSSLLIASMILSFTACSSTAKNDNSSSSQTTSETSQQTSDKSEVQKPDTVTIRSYNADYELTDTEVPFDPQRIAVLDMPSLDILDSLGLGDRVVGSSGVSIQYLKGYNPSDSNGRIANLGSVKEADLEQIAICEPDVIFMGGRLAGIYKELSAIAPVVYLGIDHDKGIVKSTQENARTIASMFGRESEVDSKFEGYSDRIEALRANYEGKNAVLGMYNNNSLGLQDSKSQLSILVKEIGFVNLSDTVGTTDKANHGEDASWETIIRLDPEYMFILDRSSAVGSTDEMLGAREVIENDLVKELDVYKDGNISYFIENANVWYISAGGIQALDTMLSDLEAVLTV